MAGITPNTAADLAKVMLMAESMGRLPQGGAANALSNIGAAFSMGAAVNPEALMKQSQDYTDAVRRGDTSAMNAGVAQFSGTMQMGRAMQQASGAPTGIATGPDPPVPTEEEQRKDPNAMATWRQICMNNARLRGDHARADALERDQMAESGSRYADAMASAPPRSSAPTARSEELKKLDKLFADAQARGDLPEAMKLRDLVLAKGKEYNGVMDGPATGVPGYISPSGELLNEKGSSSSSSSLSSPSSSAPPPPSSGASVGGHVANPMSAPAPGSMPVPPPAAPATVEEKEKMAAAGAPSPPTSFSAVQAAAPAPAAMPAPPPVAGTTVTTTSATVSTPSAPAVTNTSQQLPPGWSQHEDPKSGAFYYCNITTGETSWSRPTATAPSSPPPPQPVGVSAAGHPQATAASMADMFSHAGSIAAAAPPPSSTGQPRSWTLLNNNEVRFSDGSCVITKGRKLRVWGPGGVGKIKFKNFMYTAGMQAGASGSASSGPKATEFVRMEGYLTKLAHRKSLFNKEVWQKRFFVLEKDTLTYYKNDKRGKVRGMIPLVAGGWVARVDVGQDRRKDAFDFRDRQSVGSLMTATVGSLVSEYDGKVTKNHCLAVHKAANQGNSLDNIMGKNIFQLRNTTKQMGNNSARTYYILANSDAERDEWVAALQNNMEYAQLSGETAVSQAEAEHPNPAVNTVMKAMRTLGGDPSKLDVEGALQTMFNL